MLVDCESCSVRGTACGDCVVTLLLDTSPYAQSGIFHQLGAEEVRAIEVLELAGFEVTVLDPTHFETVPVTPVPAPRHRRGRAA
ncbi:hypothetical protein ABT297_22015 [Dactylosporangium sp. NPDC000555]|uniref:hypothetical protein n=1 Tax=Dactylosporangium sp. NPDC000555 TaxID=3154260 RepID=UPI00331C63BF